MAQPVRNALTVFDYISASANTTKTYTNNFINSLKIKNDGASDISVTINGLTMAIKPSEVFEESVATTNTFTITAAVAFRCWVRE
jgi:hypothetical protein